MLTASADKFGAKRDVRDEMAVHDIEMQPVGPGQLDAHHFQTDFAKIRREERRSNHHEDESKEAEGDCLVGKRN